MTPKQSELYKLATDEYTKLGGGIAIRKNAELREQQKIEGSKMWAIATSANAGTKCFDNIFTDEYCQYLIDCIKK